MVLKFSMGKLKVSVMQQRRAKEKLLHSIFKTENLDTFESYFLQTFKGMCSKNVPMIVSAIPVSLYSYF